MKTKTFKHKQANKNKLWKQATGKIKCNGKAGDSELRDQGSWVNFSLMTCASLVLSFLVSSKGLD